MFSSMRIQQEIASYAERQNQRLIRKQELEATKAMEELEYIESHNLHKRVQGKFLKQSVFEQEYRQQISKIE